jgi:hypothetical protein
MKFWGTKNNTLANISNTWCWKISQCRGDRLYFFISLTKYGMIFYPQERTEMICFAGSQSTYNFTGIKKGKTP